MNSRPMQKILRTIVILLLILSPLVSGYSSEYIPKEKFLEDCSILKSALDKLHPGLYRYNDETSLLNSYNELINFPGDSITLENAFLIISEFLAKIKCGHTYANPYNQSENIAEAIFKGNNKLPFTFLMIGKEMVIMNDVSGEDLGRGSRVFEINGIPVENIVEDLVRFSDGDGSNESQRLNNLNVTGFGEYEFFDIYFPLIVPPVDGKYELEYNNVWSRAGFLGASVLAISRDERRSRLEKEYGLKQENYDEQWKFKILDTNSALLSIGTFVTFKMKLDWKKFLADSFGEMNRQNIPNLIIDIRGNAGGTTEVAGEIISYLTTEPIDVMMEKRLVSYEKIPDELAQYLSTWDESFKDRTGTVEKYSERLFLLKDGSGNDEKIYPKENSYHGKTYVLTNASNSSATFILAKILKKNGLATLVGQTTGGNQRGINGGQLMFLELPNSGIEVDIPLIGYFPDGNFPDAGLEPDVLIEKDYKDIANEVDTELLYVLEMLKSKSEY